jgi:DNA-binding MarR family transcriptional regulator
MNGLSREMVNVLRLCAETEDGRVPVNHLVRQAQIGGQCGLAVARSSTSRRIHRLAARGLLNLDPPRRATSVELTDHGWDAIADVLVNGGVPTINTRLNGTEPNTEPTAWWRRLMSGKRTNG